MTPRDLFIIILRIIGLFVAKDFLTLLPMEAYAFLRSLFGHYHTSLLEVFAGVMMFAVYLLLVWVLIFMPQLIVRLLRLDKGFDQANFPVNVPQTTVLRISVLVIGGWMLVNNLPNFCLQLYQFINAKKNHVEPDASRLIIPGVRLILALMLLSAQKEIVSWIEKKSSN